MSPASLIGFSHLSRKLLSGGKKKKRKEARWHLRRHHFPEKRKVFHRAASFSINRISMFRSPSAKARANVICDNSLSVACSVIFIISLLFNNSQHGPNFALITTEETRSSNINSTLFIHLAEILIIMNIVYFSSHSKGCPVPQKIMSGNRLVTFTQRQTVVF